MPRIDTICPYCEEVTSGVDEYRTDESLITNLACGHTLVKPIESAGQAAYKDIRSLSGKTPFPFQIESAEFAENAGLRWGCLHEMGLGKTVCDLIVHKMHPELFPWMILCKSALKYNWFHEVIDWLGPEYTPQIIDNSKERPYPEFFKVIIVSLDLLRNCPWRTDVKVNSVTIDECQLIKNHQSKRTNAARSICEQVDKISLLSGTPIHNHAGEYFTALNIIRPNIFPTQAGYIRNHVNAYNTGWGVKIGSLSDPKGFKKLTEPFIFRKTREEVMPELPKKFYSMKYDVLGDHVKLAYEKEEEEFSEEYGRAGCSAANFTNILAYLSRMRHLTGLSKIEMTSDFVMDFLRDTDRKMVVFYHHQDVGNILATRLNNLCAAEGFSAPLRLTADNPEKRAEYARISAETHWVSRDPNDRILLASTLVAGEGLNLQACSDGVMMERQWTPIKEVQAEDRFVRIGSEASQVNITYMLALETIDEWITELIEGKRSTIAATIDAKEVFDEQGMVAKLAELIFTKGTKKWVH